MGFWEKKKRVGEGGERRRERGYIRNPKNISENRDGRNQLYNEGSNVEKGWVAEDKRRTRAWYRKGKKEVGVWMDVLQ